MNAVGWLLVALIVVSIVATVAIACLISLLCYTRKIEEELKDEIIRKNLGNREKFQ